jgi:hypothetical protein
VVQAQGQPDRRLQRTAARADRRQLGANQVPGEKNRGNSAPQQLLHC